MKLSRVVTGQTPTGGLTGQTPTGGLTVFNGGEP
jgi:hypothetical protein